MNENKPTAGKYFNKVAAKHQPDPALGIPDRGKTQSIPNISSPVIWEGGIHLHEAKRAGTHYDLRLGDPSTHYSHSWAMRKLPASGEKVLAIHQPTHTLEYMDFKGTIKDGYGAGKVKLHFRDKIEVLESSPARILFNLYKGNKTEKYALISRGGVNWILFNYTTTDKDKLIPLTKPSYKEKDFDNLDTENSNEVFAPKMDGAHNIFILRPNKRVQTFSYRPSKGRIERIDHTYKTDLYKHRSPSSLGTTVVRGELYLPGKTSPEVGSVLNSNVFLAREKQQKVGQLQNMMFDVVTYKGKNVEALPYREKIEILKTINKEFPKMKIPAYATTSQTKKNLVSSIKDKQHEDTDEGVVIYNLDSPLPIKAKIRRDFDLYIKDFYDARPGRLTGKGVGGIIGTETPNHGTEIRVGSGLTDEQRQDMYNNPEKYKGKLIKIYAQEKLKSGKFRMPVFKEFRDYERWANKQ
jgi:hypothetical protein